MLREEGAEDKALMLVLMRGARPRPAESRLPIPCQLSLLLWVRCQQHSREI